MIMKNVMVGSYSVYELWYNIPKKTLANLLTLSYIML